MLTYNAKCAVCNEKIEFVTDDDCAFEVNIRKLKPSPLYAGIFTADQSLSITCCQECYKNLINYIEKFENGVQNERK